MTYLLFTEKPGKPDAPTITKMMPKTGAIAWKPPADDGGAEIFNYVVEYRVDGDVNWMKANTEDVPDLKYTVTGLRPGKMYEFRIAAQNKAGVGPPSDPTAPAEAKEHIGKLAFPAEQLAVGVN